MPHPVSATVPGRHADHNLLLVSTNAAGDATGRELDEALALVAGCPDCAALHHDLRAIAAAMAALPAPVRTRDFRLTPEQAAALRPAGWRRLLAPFAGPRFSFAAPLGTALATLGIAGILVSGGIGLPLAGSAASMAEAPAPEVPMAAGAPAAAPAASAEAEDKASGSTANEAAPMLQAPAASDAGAYDAEAATTVPVAGGEAVVPAPAAVPAVPAAEASPAVRMLTAAPLAPAEAPAPVVEIAAAVALLAGAMLLLLRFAGRRALRTP